MRRAVVRILVSSVLVVAGLAVAGRAAASETPAPPAPGGSFHAVDGGRILDTRTGLGGRTGRFQHFTVPVRGLAGIPTSGVSAVQVTLKVIEPVATGYGIAWALGRSRPGTRNLSFTPGRTSSQTSVVPVDGDSFAVFLSHSGYLIVDVSGYFTDADHADGGGLMHTMTPRRVLAGATLAAGSTRTVRVTGGQVPSDAVAVIANLTVGHPTAAGALTAFGTGRPRPQPIVNFPRGLTTSGRAIVPVGTGGTITLYNGPGSVGVHVDITGYFVTRLGGAYYVAGRGQRAFSSNSRQVGYVSPHRRLLYDGFMPVLARSVTRPVAVLGSLTITPHPSYGARSGFVVSYPAGSSRPGTYDLAYSAAQTAQSGTMIVTKLGAPADVAIDNPANNVAETVDVNGVFVVPAPDPLPRAMYAWNNNQLDVSTVNAPSDVLQFAGDGQTVTVLRGDGSVETWDNHLTNPPEREVNRRVVVPELSDVTGVANATGTGFALRDGDVYSWGSNTYGRLGTGSAAASSAVPTRISGLPSIAALGAGTFEGYAITADGDLYGWGYNAHGELGDGGTTDHATPVQVPVPGNVVAVAGTEGYQYAVTDTHKLYRWGRGATPAELSAGCDAKSVVARRDDYLVLCTTGQLADNVSTRPDTAGGFVLAAPSSGLHGFQLLREDGTVWSAGGSAGSSRDMVQVPGLTGIDVIGNTGAWNAAVRHAP